MKYQFAYTNEETVGESCASMHDVLRHRNRISKSFDTLDNGWDTGCIERDPEWVEECCR